MKQTNFAKSLWKENTDLARTIPEHPFVRDLAEDTLPREDFQHYVAQDASYLESFGVYALALAHSPDRYRIRRPHASLRSFGHPLRHNRLLAPQYPAPPRRPVAPQHTNELNK